MGLFAKFASVGGATAGSRVLGFVREAMIAATLGAGPVADAFYAAFRFPNLFRRLFAEGAFNSAFVPLFAKEVEANGRDEAAKFAGDVFSALSAILVVLTVICMAFMPFLVATVIAPGFSDTPDKFTLTSDLARIMFPYMAAMSLVAMLSGILNTFRSYFLAAAAPMLLNVVLIAVLVYAQIAALPARDTGYAMAFGIVVSGCLQLGVLVYAMTRTGFRFRPRALGLSPKVRRLLALAGPAALTGGIVQVNIVIGQIIASQQDKAISWLSYADRVYQLPLGVIGIAIGVVLLPELSRALSAGNLKEASTLQDKSLEFGLGLTLPAAAALVVMPGEVVAILYERGAFTPDTTSATAAALAGFAIGLPAFVLIKILQPAFFAREDMRSPMWVSLVSVVVNVAVSLALFPRLGHVGVALATSIAAWVNAAFLAGLLVRSGHFAVGAATGRRLAVLVLATLAMTGTLVVHQMWTADLFAASGIAMRLGLFGIAFVAASGVYFGLALLLGGFDRSLLRMALRRKR